MWHDLKTIRVYECNPQLMGYRVLVDRLWPRGLRKEALGFFVWEKEIAPSTELRKWFNHEPENMKSSRDAIWKNSQIAGKLYIFSKR